MMLLRAQFMPNGQIKAMKQQQKDRFIFRGSEAFDFFLHCFHFAPEINSTRICEMPCEMHM